MQLENYIQDLLYAHNCVVIPDFGGFITEVKSVEVHPITHRFTPPSKRIAFNEQLKVQDGLLATTIAREEGIELSEALEKIKRFVSAIREELRINNNYVFHEIGKLFYNVENKLEFEPDTRVNYLEESFGLQELFFKPIDRKQTDMSTPQRPVRPVVRKQLPPTVQSQKETTSETPAPKKGSVLKMVMIVIPILLLVGVGALIVYTKNNDKSLASFNIFGNSKQIASESVLSGQSEESSENADSLVATGEEELASDTYTSEGEEFSTQIGATTVLQPEENPAKQTLIDKQRELSDSGISVAADSESEAIGASSAKNGRYFVIVGSFLKKENAYKFRNKIAKSGGHVTVIEPSSGSGFYKVAFDDFDNKEDALRMKDELGDDFGSSVWVMSF